MPSQHELHLRLDRMETCEEEARNRGSIFLRLFKHLEACLHILREYYQLTLSLVDLSYLNSNSTPVDSCPLCPGAAPSHHCKIVHVHAPLTPPNPCCSPLIHPAQATILTLQTALAFGRTAAGKTGRTKFKTNDLPQGMSTDGNL